MDWKLELDRGARVGRRPGEGVLRRSGRLRRWTANTVRGDDFRVVQLTPPGSACSIAIGKGLKTGEPGTVKGLQLVVEDIEAARAELIDRGVDAGDFFHFGAGGQTAGLHPERESYGLLLVRRPDGNAWLVQEVKR